MRKTEIYEEIKRKKVITIRVKPNSNRTQILSYKKDKDEYQMEVAAPPEDNRANLEIIKHLAKMTGKRPRIKSGLSSKRKNIVFN